jgi:4-hydroxy-tetrahydrodipicolinate synthase
MFHGSIVALITPMKSEGEIDYACVDELLEFHLCNNTDGIVLVGTTGESGTLSESEQHKLVHYVVKRVNSKLPVIVGTGSSSGQTGVKEY